MMQDNTGQYSMQNILFWNENPFLLLLVSDLNLCMCLYVPFRSVGGTGFIGTYDGCTYLFTCLHCFIENKEVEQNITWLKRGANKRILKERAIDMTYWFHYMDGSGVKKQVLGKEFIDESKDIPPKVDIVSTSHVTTIKWIFIAPIPHAAPKI